MTVELLTSKRALISIVVILLGLNVGYYWIRAHMTEVPQGDRIVESERNERSTPRSFILPATPAVAFEQEMRAAKDPRLASAEHQLALCASRLIDLGYDVGDEAVAFNAKLAEAIYEYQETHGLHATGRIDRATILRLSCKAT